MVHGENRIPYWIDRSLTGLAGPDYDATISFGLPFEPEDSQYGKYRLRSRPAAAGSMRVSHTTSVARDVTGLSRMRRRPTCQAAYLSSGKRLDMQG